MSTITVRKLQTAEPTLPLGERLVAAGLITPDQLQVALTEQSRRDEPLGRILVRLGLISEGVMRDMLGETLGHESIDLSTVIPDPDALIMVPKDIARRYHLLPINFRQESKSPDPGNGRYVQRRGAGSDGCVARQRYRS